jgi:hypothetical protein
MYILASLSGVTLQKGIHFFLFFFQSFITILCKKPHIGFKKLQKLKKSNEFRLRYLEFYHPFSFNVKNKRMILDLLE